MKSWIFLISTLSALIVLTFFGVPFEMSAGRMQVVGDKLHFVTSSSGLAGIAGAAHGASAVCRRVEICVRPTDRSGFRTNMPILYEPCDSRDAGVAAKECNDSTLRLKILSSHWIQTSLWRRL